MGYVDTEQLDCVVIGAGVVGLAIARALGMAGRSVTILEAESSFGTVTSARNSEVIHAGIYYPTDGQKAALCVPGKWMLYDYCRSRNIDHQQCGKYIVAAHQSQQEQLLTIRQNGIANGVDDLVLLNAQDMKNRQPDLRAHMAIWSPSTGIVDSHQLMLSLLADIEATSGTLVLNTKVISAKVHSDGHLLEVNSGRDSLSISARTVINSAGLGAIPLAKTMVGLGQQFVPEIEYAKGSYFSYSGPTPFKSLVYPIPTPGGLGIHLTLDQAGMARFGPDVEWVDAVNYDVNPDAKARFLKEIADYWPDVEMERLVPAYSGIRAKVMAKGKSYHDFIFSGPDEHGIEGLVNLFGMESPGLTSCLAIADKVAAMVEL